MLLATLVGGAGGGVVAQDSQKDEQFCIKEEVVVHRGREPRELFCYVSGKFEGVRGYFESGEGKSC